MKRPSFTAMVIAAICLISGATWHAGPRWGPIFLIALGAVVILYDFAAEVINTYIKRKAIKKKFEKYKEEDSYIIP